MSPMCICTESGFRVFPFLPWKFHFLICYHENRMFKLIDPVSRLFDSEGARAVNPTIGAKRITSSPQTAQTLNLARRLGALDVLVLAVWCGLAAGLLEVGTRVLCRAINPVERLYLMSRHFVWLTPLVNLSPVSRAGIVHGGAHEGLASSRRLGWSPLDMCPGHVADADGGEPPRSFPRPGSSWRSELRHGWSPFSSGGGPSFDGAWYRPFLCCWEWSSSWPVPSLAETGSKRAAKPRRAQPPAGSPNVLLIVLDTVRADHLSLYGYQRPTTPTLERLAKHGVRFDAARATAPWTLMSHASFFTGRWPHELDVEWLTPLRKNYPMLAEYLGAHGYATAGFVSNVQYCSYDTGLDRGFTYYEDYVLEKLSPFRTSVMVEEALTGIVSLGSRQDSGRIACDCKNGCGRYSGTRCAAMRGRSIEAFLSWLDRRPEPGTAVLRIS